MSGIFGHWKVRSAARSESSFLHHRSDSERVFRTKRVDIWRAPAMPDVVGPDERERIAREMGAKIAAGLAAGSIDEGSAKYVDAEVEARLAEWYERVVDSEVSRIEAAGLLLSVADSYLVETAHERAATCAELTKAEHAFGEMSARLGLSIPETPELAAPLEDRAQPSSLFTGFALLPSTTTTAPPPPRPVDIPVDDKSTGDDVPASSPSATPAH